MYTIILFFFVTIILLFVGAKFESTKIILFDLSRSYTNILRGIAMVLIMSGHVAGVYSESIWWSPLPTIGVTLFLLLSGYGNNESYKNKKEWGGVKLLRIAIPYWIVRTIVFFVGFTSFERINWKSLILDYTFIDIKSVFWFVGFIMKWYAAYWIGIKFFKKYRYHFWLMLSILIFIFMETTLAIHSFDFIIGIMLSDRKEKNMRIIKNKVVLLGTLSVLLFVVFLGLKQIPIIRNTQFVCDVIHTLMLLFGTFGSIFLLWKFKSIVNNRILLFIAPITYELYMVHMKCLPVISYDSPFQICYTTLLFILLSFIGAISLHKIDSVILKKL